MVKKICNHCGKIYVGKECECRKKNKKYTNTKNYYNTPRWKRLSKFIRERDYNQDRLAMYLSAVNVDDNEIKKLKEFLVLPGNIPRMFDGLIIVHHIIPVDEDESLMYEPSNLISLKKDTHEYIHKLYKTKNKKKIQELLRNAVKFGL